MAQVLVLYNTPAEPAAIDSYYHQIQLGQKIPGLCSYVIRNGPVQDLAEIAPHLPLEAKELGRHAELVGQSKDSALEDVSHHITEPAAKKLQKTHAWLAARLWRAQGMRIINAKKSKYYNAALENFEQARRCYERAGLGADWQCVVERSPRPAPPQGQFYVGFR